MILSYIDLFGDGKRKRIKATITTEHSSSSYGQPVILLDGGDGLNWESIVMLLYRVEKATKKERILLERLNPALKACTGYALES